MSVSPTQLDVYRTTIPMRTFEHAAASRDRAEAVVVRMEFSDGRVGWGETLPREYVTRETPDTAVRDLKEFLWPACAKALFRVKDAVAEVPTRDEAGRCINAAACALDLACLRRLFPGDGGAASGAFTALAGRPGPRKEIDSRVSGVLGSADPGKTARRLRVMRCFGLRDFKLKLGLGEDVDGANLRVVHRQIGKAVACGKCSLRVDVNGAWDVQSTPERVAALREFGVCVVEQPASCSPAELLVLARKCSLPLMADESLRTEDDAQFLLQEPKKVWWNIRLSKNGGFIRSLLLARMAGEHRIPFTVGCMVGESSILSAAQRLLLQWSPMPRFVEGNYGRFLLADDLVRKPLRFGYAGRLRPIKHYTSDADVEDRKLERYGRLVATLRA